MIRHFMLPDGTNTAKEYEYKEAWGELIETVENMFPGYRCTNFNPAMRFVCQETADFFVLTPKAVKALKVSIRAMRDNR